jgi:immune inhibitor A
MNRKAQIALIAGLSILCGCLAILGGGLAWLFVWDNGRQPGVAVASTATLGPSVTRVLSTDTPPPTGTPRSTDALVPAIPALPAVTPTLTPAPLVPRPSDTVERLLAAELPQRDIRLLAERLGGQGPIPLTVREAPLDYQLGDVETFWVGNLDSLEHTRVTAVLRYITPHLYVWVEDGVSVDQGALARDAEQFEQHTYPTTRAFFGSEWSPGVDADPHLHVLHSTAREMGNGLAGYYSSADEYSRLANPYSNEREMFYLSLSGIAPGTDLYDGVLAHEFQHMIHWANDRNEETWVDEGCSELSAHLNGYDPGGFEWAYIADPDVQLTNWPSAGSSAANYGASYLFMRYFLGRFGPEATQAVVARPENGSVGFNAVLAAYDLTFEDVFADWLVANYVDNLALAASAIDPVYAYADADIGPVSIDVSHSTYPVSRESTVHQYAADYIQLQGVGDFTIEFEGDTEAWLVPADAYSGRYAWWSNRSDDSDVMLTRAFDLSGLETATLQVRMWYDIEEDWDYAYVEASIDDGQTWDLLVGPSMRVSNPNGNSFGPAYTGQSAGWTTETFDLSPYAGHSILLRFEYVTDDAVHRAGWLIDDVRIPELNFADDMESGTGDWHSRGFVYSDNRVPQGYLVQLIALGQTVSVLPLATDDSGYGRIELRGLGAEIDTAVLVIAAVAPSTTQAATYRYAIEATGGTSTGSGR